MQVFPYCFTDTRLGHNCGIDMEGNTSSSQKQTRFFPYDLSTAQSHHGRRRFVGFKRSLK